MTPCEGSLSSTECTHSCRDDSHVHHGERDETSCERNFKCTPQDLCSVSSDNECSPEALCVSIPCKDTEEFQTKGTCLNTYECRCRDGLQGSGRGNKGCVNINECTTSENDCHRNAKCTDLVPSLENDWNLKYSCACHVGFKGDGRTSCDPEKICEIVQNQGLCHADAVCSPCGSSEHCRDSPRPSLTKEKYKCVCAQNQKGDGFANNDGMSTGCTYIDFCRDEEFAHECNEHATCVSLDRGQYDCVCADGFAKIGQGRGSDGCVNVNECEDFKTNDCHIGARCNDLVPSESNGFQKYVFFSNVCELLTTTTTTTQIRMHV